MDASVTLIGLAAIGIGAVYYWRKKSPVVVAPTDTSSFKAEITTLKAEKSALEAKIKTDATKIDEADDALSSAREHFGEPGITSFKVLGIAFRKYSGEILGFLEDFQRIFPEARGITIPLNPNPATLRQVWKALANIMRELVHERTEALRELEEARRENVRLASENAQLNREILSLEAKNEKAIGVAHGAIEARIDSQKSQVLVSGTAVEKQAAAEARGRLAVFEAGAARSHEVAMKVPPQRQQNPQPKKDDSQDSGNRGRGGKGKRQQDDPPAA